MPAANSGPKMSGTALPPIHREPALDPVGLSTDTFCGARYDYRRHLLEGIMGAAVFVMTDGRLYSPTISMTVNFMARANTGPITGEAKVTQLGKSIGGPILFSNG